MDFVQAILTILLVVFAFMYMIGSSTEKSILEFNEYLDSFIGTDSSKVISVYGSPTRIVEQDYTRTFVYIFTREHTSMGIETGQVYNYGYGSSYHKTYIPPKTTIQTMTIMFEIDYKGEVLKWYWSDGRRKYASE